VSPTWLSLADHSDGTATLSGTPTDADLGDHAVTLRVEDMVGALDTQVFTITVLAHKPGTSFVYLPVALRDK